MLTGIGEGGKKVPYHLGHFFLAIDTEAFVGAESFKKTAGDILRALRASTRAQAKTISSRRREGVERWCERKDSGVPINDAVQKELCTVRDQLGLTQYTFPWEK